jgi:heat-inducible transcriptional repressor
MAFENLSEREKQILLNLITHYIGTADPVGSRVIANRFKMGISSATVRNTLQDLEELGLVEQPHTSAGRVPTDMGYRMYVDYLLKPESLTQAEKDGIKGSILQEGRGINELLGQTARVLGDISSQLGVAIAPRFESGRLKSIRFIPVTGDKIMAVVVLQSGLARSMILEIEVAFSEAELSELETVLNERLAGLTLAEIRRTFSERIADVAGSARLLKLVVDTKDKIWTDEQKDIVQVSGTERLLSMPEFADREELSKLIKALEDNKIVSDFLGQADREGLVITIGHENKINEIMNCSLVTSSYRVGSISGSIGIIGPTRMPYNKLVSIVEYTAKSITRLLSGMEDKKV